MTPPRLVVLRALGLGDLFTAIPALRALSRAFAGHERILVAPAAFAPLVVGPLGLVDRVADTRVLEPLADDLHDAEIAVNLHGRGPQSTALLAATDPRRLLTFGLPGGPAWSPDEHERDRWCRLLTGFGIDADPGDFRIGRVDHPIAESADGATIVHPGAASAARRWPADRWAAVATAERRAGRQVLITGNTAERAIGLQIADAAGLPHDAVVAGRTSVVELVALVGAVGRVLCGDTGIAHVASALGTPSVVLFGPTPPAWWGPPPDGPHLALWHGGRGDPHGSSVDPALEAITVDEVLVAISELPVAQRSGR